MRLNQTSNTPRQRRAGARREWWACLWLAATVTATADQGWEGQSLNFTWENDATRGSDRHYTQGARILYLSSDTGTPDWVRRLADHLPALGYSGEGLKYGVEVGQEIYTPEDLDTPSLVKNDRPYAGWLYGAAILQRRGPASADLFAMETLRLDVGVIGPESQADVTQKIWHGRDPKGWPNQLKTEPGLVFRYERSYLFRMGRAGGWNVDGVPSFDAALGNLDVHFAVKATARIGYNIPNRYEVPKGRTRRRFSVYSFAAMGARAVGHNLFLDGNTWRQSPSVEKEPIVGTASLGLAVALGPVEIIGSNNYLTREFHGQKTPDSYGSAIISFKF